MNIPIGTKSTLQKFGIITQAGPLLFQCQKMEGMLTHTLWAPIWHAAKNHKSLCPQIAGKQQQAWAHGHLLAAQFHPDLNFQGSNWQARIGDQANSHAPIKKAAHIKERLLK
jgi:hypothetical protein